MGNYIPPHLRGKARTINPGPQHVTLPASNSTNHTPDASTHISNLPSSDTKGNRFAVPTNDQGRTMNTSRSPSPSLTSAGGVTIYASKWTPPHVKAANGVRPKQAAVHTAPEKQKAPRGPLTPGESQNVTLDMTVGTSLSNTSSTLSPFGRKPVLHESTWSTQAQPTKAATLSPPYTTLAETPTPRSKTQAASVTPIEFAHAQASSAQPVSASQASVKASFGNGALVNHEPVKTSNPLGHKKSPERQNKWPTKEEYKMMRARPMSWSSDTEHDAWGQENNVWDECHDYNSPWALIQFDGGWLPASVEWEGRRGYKQENFAEAIATWIDRTNRHHLHLQHGGSKTALPVRDLKGIFLTQDVDYAPRCWIPEKIEGAPLQAFWQSIQESNLEPIYEEDLQWAPYWQRYLGNENDFQTSVEVPTAHLNPGDGDQEMYFRGKNQTSADNIEQKAREVAMSERRKKKIKDIQKRAQKEEARKSKIAPPPHLHRPSVNIYLRPAMSIDLDQILLIFNHYAERTCYSVAMTPMTRQELVDKLRDIERAHLNMIVAIHKVNQVPKDQRTTLQSTQEKLVGFAFAEEHEGRNALFRYAADLEVFVHPDYLGKGVGKSLMDRMLFLMDTEYNLRGAVEWRVSPDCIDLKTKGGKRVLTTVRINVLYPSDEPVRLVWLERWLQQFKFEKRGQFEGGIKIGKDVSQAIFQLRTGTNVDPATAFIGSAY